MASLDDLEGMNGQTEQDVPEILNEGLEEGEYDNSDNSDNSCGQMDDLTEKLAQTQDKYLRLSAEFDNYRKRTLRERYDLIKTAGEDVIKDLLPVIDDFDRAMGAIVVSADVTALADGVQLIQDKLLGILKQKGLAPIVTIGLDFDPEVSEAVASIPAAANMKGKVVEEIQKGYILNDKIIRYPKVVVGE